MSRRESHRRLRGWAVAATAVLACLPASAGAAGQPGDVYVLDIGRTMTTGGNPPIVPAPGRIVEVDPSTGAEIREIVPTGPGVEPLNNPVAITVDAYGFLIVSDHDGYNANYTIDDPGFPYNCNNTGCGAVLRVDPVSGAATILTRGPLAQNPNGVLLPRDGDLFDDGGGVEDRMLLLDTGGQHILSVDVRQPVDSNQTFFWRNYEHTTRPDGQYDGLRSPWDIARDPDTGDILVVNNGANPLPIVGIPGCEDGGDPGYADGYITRMSEASGQILEYFCHPDFRHPRGLAAAAGGRMFMADPFAASGSQFAAVFSITDGGVGKAKDVQMLSLGENLLAPGGVGFSYEGDDLLVADESAFPPPIADCVGSGCGGVIAMNALSGDQTPFSSRGTPGYFRDPIDVAVDRRGAPAPFAEPEKERCRFKDCCPKRKPKCKRVIDFVHFFNVGSGTQKAFGVSGESDGIRILLMESFGEKAKVRFQCLSAAGCPVQRQTQTAANGKVRFDFAGQPLEGSFRITAYVPFEGKRRNIKKVYLGRYREFTVDAVTGEISRGSGGCLIPGAAKVRAKNPKTTTRCPRPDGH